MRIKDLCREIHKYSKVKGWWDRPRNPLEIHMLMVSEIAEATEEVRDKRRGVYITDNSGHTVDHYTDINDKGLWQDVKDGYKPEGEMVELADCVIRIMDYFDHQGWDLEKTIQLKMECNKKRPFRHGGKEY